MPSPTVTASLLTLTMSTAVIEPVSDTSRIDWTAMRVEAVGKGNVITNAADYTKAELNSMKFANTTLQHAVFEIDIDSKTDYQSLLDRNDELSRNLESVAKRYQVSDVVYVEGDAVESTAFLDMHDLLRSYIIERSGVESRVRTPRRGEHTGVIIDARNVEFEPIVLPTIAINGDDKWLSIESFSRYTAQSKFPFMYATSASSADVIAKVGSNPALYAADSVSLDTIKVHNIDSSPLTTEERDLIMGNGRVVILLSSE